MAIITGTSGADSLTGTAGADEISGLAGSDRLVGGAGSDTLLGGAAGDSLVGGTGADVLNGGTGADTMNGGGGNDTYTVDDAADQVAEVSTGGIDEIRASVSYVLGAHVESLTLTGSADIDGTGNNLDNTLTGNNGVNRLNGLGGNDTLAGAGGQDTLLGGDGVDSLVGGGGGDSLNGGAGADAMAGGSGNDRYVVERASDAVTELAGEGLADTIVSSVSYMLPDEVERLTLSGTANINGIGNAVNNIISGNAGENILNGGAGNDRLNGGDGDDTLIYDAADGRAQGGGGSDTLKVNGAGVTLDLTATANGVHSNLEVIDLTGSGDNTLMLAQGDVLAFSTTSNTLRVDGNAGDAVAATGSWILAQNMVIGAQTYAEYHYGVFNANGAAILQVDGDIDRSDIQVEGMILGALDGSNGFRLEGVGEGDRSAISVASAGDVNGDGFGDVIVGAYLADPNGTNSGSSYVVFGKAAGFDASINLSTLDGTDGFRLDGVALDDRSGTAVAGVGDVNGDGIGDLIVGARNVNANGADSGASYVVFGQSSGFDASTNLSTLNGVNGFRLEGVAAEDLAGRAVAAAGDVNGDGYDDLIVGATDADVLPEPDLDSGASYVVFGKASGFAASIDLSTLDGANGFRLEGDTGYDSAGRSVAAAGDVNGDGLGDVIVGAPRASPSAATTNEGASYVVFGQASGFGASVDPSTLDGANGFRLVGAADNDFAGRSVSAAGDVNGDGFGDVIVGAYGATNGSGAAYVVFGKSSGFAASMNLSTLDGTNGFEVEGVALGDLAGRAVSGAGDVNGDGFDDIIVGAYGANPSGRTGAGETYILFGKASGFAANFNPSTIDGVDGFRLEGMADGDNAGRTVGAAGDVNGDGFADLIVGADRADPNGTDSGASYVVFGGDFTGSVMYLGTSGADTFNGTNNAFETFVTGQGNDTINSAQSADIVRAGSGNDQINIVNVPGLFSDIDGGSGTDTLVLQGGVLALGAIADNKLTGIERITILGANALSLAELDLLNLSDTTNQLRVDDDATPGGGTVNLLGTWTDGGAGATYHTYTSGAATILIDNDIFVV